MNPKAKAFVPKNISFLLPDPAEEPEEPDNPKFTYYPQEQLRLQDHRDKNIKTTTISDNLTLVSENSDNDPGYIPKVYKNTLFTKGEISDYTATVFPAPFDYSIGKSAYEYFDFLIFTDYRNGDVYLEMSCDIRISKKYLSIWVSLLKEMVVKYNLSYSIWRTSPKLFKSLSKAYQGEFIEVTKTEAYVIAKVVHEDDLLC